MEYSPSSNTLWCAVAVVLIIVLSTKIARALCQGRPSQLPPLVNGFSLLALLPSLLKKGLPVVLNDLYVKHGSVFMVSCFGLLKVTFLVGPEVTGHIFQGLDSEISQGNMLEFTVPMFGREVGYGRDRATRMEQAGFFLESFKPSRLSSHVSPMLQEVESYFAKWGKEGIVDLKVEFDRLLMLISSRCLLGKEVRENMFDEVDSLFLDIGHGLNLISILFPYLPTPTNCRRDRARIKLTEILSDVVKSRKRSGRVEEDTLQRLIDCKYKDGRSTTVAEVVGLILTLLFAGKHTTSISSTWVGACLLGRPTFVGAAIEEQEQIRKKYTDGGLVYQAFMEMETLHNCIKEALRMHPPVPWLFRKAHKNFMVQTKEGKLYDIAQDQFVGTPILMNHHIPSIYKDPHVYDPYRFGPERKEDKVGGKFSYTPFSSGRHTCKGEAYAYLQLKVIWSHMLKNFELELMSPFPKTVWRKYVPEQQGKVVVRYKRTN